MHFSTLLCLFLFWACAHAPSSQPARKINSDDSGDISSLIDGNLGGEEGELSDEAAIVEEELEDQKKLDVMIDNSQSLPQVLSREEILSLSKTLRIPDFFPGHFKLTKEQDKMVQFWINFFTFRDRERFLQHYQNGRKYRALVDHILSQHQIPLDIFYVGLIESGFNLKIKSRAKAVGPWQFIPGTGKRYGLKINSHLDERMNIFKSTHAAARYLKTLYKIFGDWTLALAAYNAGETKVLKAIKRGKTRDLGLLSRKRLLPRETRYYVPKLIAVKTILENSHYFDWGTGRTDQETLINHSPFALKFNTNLERLETIAKIPRSMVMEFNPDIKTEYIPASVHRPFKIYLPQEEHQKLAILDQDSLMAMEVPAEKVKNIEISSASQRKFRHYIVKKGDSLFKIAARFNISLKELITINSLESKRIFPKQRIMIPI